MDHPIFLIIRRHSIFNQHLSPSTGRSRPGENSLGRKPVSYTHLDVYKRQEEDGDIPVLQACSVVIPDLLHNIRHLFPCRLKHTGHHRLSVASLSPVSYTHLDVYKRQLLIRDAFMDLQDLNDLVSYGVDRVQG